MKKLWVLLLCALIIASLAFCASAEVASSVEGENIITEAIDAPVDETDTVDLFEASEEVLDNVSLEADLETAFVAEAPLFEVSGDFEIENGILKKYNGTDTEVTIPVGVTIIGEDAFYWNDTITKVIIPEGVTIIEKRAFWDCDNLASVNIPGSVTIIEDWAFISCPSLRSIDIPGSVKTIGNLAFSDCPNLSTVNIANGVTSIGSGAFSRCISLKSITIPDSVTGSSNNDGWFDLFDGCSNLESVTLPSAVKSIDGFLGCAKLDTINFSGSVATPGVLKLPDGITMIGYQAFKGCQKLTQAIIPASVNSINDEAFYQCTNLESVTIGAPKNPSTHSTGIKIYDKSFTACSSSLVFYTVCDTAATKWAKEEGFAVQPSDHVKETVAGKPSTCTKAGLSDYIRCAYCNKEFTSQTELPLAEHTPEIVPGEPSTCYSTGMSDGTRCSVCHKTLTERTPLPLADHTPETVPGYPATESSDGLTDGSRCSVCGETLVEQEVIPMLGFHMSGNAFRSVIVGDTFKIVVDGRTVKSYKSSNRKVASVAQDGTVTAKKAGKAKITINLKGKGKKKFTLTLRVTDPSLPTAVAITEGKRATVQVGQTLQLNPVVAPETALTGYTWKSSKKGVAWVDANGLVTAKKKGTAKITVTTRNKKKATITVTVVP